MLWTLLCNDLIIRKLIEGPINTKKLIEGRPSFKGKDIVRATNIRHPIVYFEF